MSHASDIIIIVIIITPATKSVQGTGQAGRQAGRQAGMMHRVTHVSKRECHAEALVTH